MVAMRTIDARNDFKKISELVKAGEKVLITRPHNENLIVMSEKEYQEIAKEQRNKAYLAMLDESLEQFKQGKVIVKTMEELEAMAAE